MKHTPTPKPRFLIPLKMTKRSRSQTPARRSRRVPALLLSISVVLLVFSHPFLRSLVRAEADMDTFHEHLTHAPRKFSNPFRKRYRRLDRKGVKEFMTTIRQDWRVAISSFLADIPLESFGKRNILENFENNIGNITATTILVQILDGNVTFTENYTSHHGRASSVKYIISKIVKEKRRSLPGVTFLVVVNDGYKPQVASFGSARHWSSWKTLIPVPLGNVRGLGEGWGTPFEGWDSYIDTHVWNTRGNFSWEQKIPKAMFRGSLCMQTHTLGSCNEDSDGCVKATRWDEVNRGVMYTVAQKRPQLFDIGFTSFKGKSEMGSGQFDEAPELVDKMEFKDFQKFKYLINVGSNQDWAERLRILLYTNSAVLLHEAETKEFFTPLLQPWVHYIPINLMFTDFVKNIEWAIENDEVVQQIVRNANAFADRYISERAMQQYWEVAIEEYATLQSTAAKEGLDQQFES